MTAGIKSLQDLRPGDLYLGPIGGPLGVAIRAAQVIVDGGWRVGPIRIEHVGIVVEAGQNEAGGDYIRGALRREGNAFLRAEPVRAPRMVQAMPHGAEEIELTPEQHWTSKCAYARIPEDYSGQAEDAAAIARLMVERDVAYSFASYAALALYRWGYRAPRLTNWIGRWQDYNGPSQLPSGAIMSGGGRLPREAICSVLADQCWSLAGKRVMENTAPQAVTPSMLGQRLLTGMEGVIWGWPSSRNPFLD